MKFDAWVRPVLVSLALAPAFANSMVATPSNAPLPTTAEVVAPGFDATTSPDGRVVSVRSGGNEVLRLTDGYRLRLRCAPNDDRWLGFDNQEISLGWSPNDQPEVAGTHAVVEEAGARLRIAITGTKPQWPNATFSTKITGELETSGSIRYTISSELRLQQATDKVGRYDAGAIEFLDVWFDKIFWPQQYFGGRERYDDLVYGTPAGVFRTPKLHVFPVTSVPSVTFETVSQPTANGSFYAVLDSTSNDGLLFSLSGLSSNGSTELCWQNWDVHFLLQNATRENTYTYTMTVTGLDGAASRALRARATRIPFERDPKYALPVFQLVGTNDFRQRVANSAQWVWERTSADAFMDTTRGFDDHSSVTIRSQSEGRKAWYSRAVWANPWYEIPITGKYRLSAMVRTSGVRAARIGVVQSDQVDPLLYEETAPAFTYSAPVSGDHEWTPVSVDFDASGRQVKVLLEQTGPGRTWFDNVRIDPLRDPLPGERAGVAFHARTDVTNPVTRFDLSEFRAVNPDVVSPTGLVLSMLDSRVSTPEVALRAGRYRLILHARGDGCPASPPVIRVSRPPVDARIEIRPDANDDYVVDFAIATAQMVSFDVAFTNDGVCDSGAGKMRDRNVFIRAISLEGPIASRRPSPASAVSALFPDVEPR